MKTFFKVVGIIFLVLTCGIFIGSDIWYLCLHNFGKDKIVEQTAIISDLVAKRTDPLTGEQITESRNFIEAKLYDNAIEIKFNRFIDPTATEFYSQGIQLVVKDEYKNKITDKYMTNGTWYAEDIIHRELSDYYLSEYELTCLGQVGAKSYMRDEISVYTKENYKYLDIYEYMSYDNFEYTSLTSDNLLSNNENFVITLKDGDNNVPYVVQFKNFELDYLDSSNRTKKSLVTDNLLKIDELTYKNYYTQSSLLYEFYSTHLKAYQALDINYFANWLINSLSSLPAGYNTETYFMLPDIFNFYEIDDDFNLSKWNADGDKLVNLYTQFSNFFKIKVEICEGKLKSSTQSMFKTFKGSSNFEDKTYIDTTDYFIGHNLIEANIWDFDWLVQENGAYKFKLSDEFIKANIGKEKSELYVVIDTDLLSNLNIQFAGFVDNTFKDFDVFKVIKISQLNGDKTETEVSYV